MSTHQARDVMLAKEAALAASFAEDAGDDLTIADDAAALLLTVLTRAAPEARKVELDIDQNGALTGDVRGLHLGAQVFIGVRAFRAMRGAQRALAAGYEHEARALDRIIVELLAHRRAIMEDESGVEALAWLQGKRGRGISARVKKIAPAELYKNLSHDSHGDPTGVARLMDEATQTIELSPKRTSATRGSLLMHAGFARDQLVVIAELAGIKLSGIQELDETIRAGWTRLHQEAADPPATS